MTPIFTSGRPICAPGAATRYWQLSASSSPPPMQMLWIAATTGLLLVSTILISVIRLGSARALGPSSSVMSAPAEKARPAPVSTMALTAGSAAAFVSPSAMPTRLAKPRPLTGGLFIVTTAMPSVTW